MWRFGHSHVHITAGLLDFYFELLGWILKKRVQLGGRSLLAGLTHAARERQGGRDAMEAQRGDSEGRF